MNELFRDYVVTSLKKTVFLSDDADKCPHEGLKGNLREIFVQELLEPYLYPSMKFCTGVIIDSFNQKSNQIDIIIYDSEVLPPAFLKRESGYIPIESVMATIEVKSVLSSTKLKESINNAISVKRLKFSEAFVRSYKSNDVPSIINTVFAFKSDLKEKRKTEFNRLEETIDKTGYIAPISSLCIAKKVLLMYGTWTNQKETDKKDVWKVIDPKEAWDETLIFLGSLVDTCNIRKRERDISFIQDYLIDNSLYNNLG